MCNVGLPKLSSIQWKKIFYLLYKLIFMSLRFPLSIINSGIPSLMIPLESFWPNYSSHTLHSGIFPVDMNPYYL